MFDEDTIFTMGNMLHRTIKIDEINLAAPLTPFVNMLGRRQMVEYEGLHLICLNVESMAIALTVASYLVPLLARVRRQSRTILMDQCQKVT